MGVSLRTSPISSLIQIRSNEEKHSWSHLHKHRFYLWTPIICLIWDSCHQSWGRAVFSKFNSSKWCLTSTAPIRTSSRKTVFWTSQPSKERVLISKRITKKRIWFRGIRMDWDTVKKLFKEVNRSSSSSSKINPCSQWLVQMPKLRTSNWYMQLRTITQTLFLKLNIS